MYQKIKFSLNKKNFVLVKNSYKPIIQDFSGAKIVKYFTAGEWAFYMPRIVQKQSFLRFYSSIVTCWAIEHLLREMFSNPDTFLVLDNRWGPANMKPSAFQYGPSSSQAFPDPPLYSFALILFSFLLSPHQKKKKNAFHFC